MDPPLSTPQPTTTTTTAQPYPDSLDSSPRSRATDFDDPFPSNHPPKLRLMCSYGGHIVPRPHDKSLCYVGGDTRIVVIDRSTTLPDLFTRLSKTLHLLKPFTLKYQLPNEDLDSLITVSTDEDLDNMIDEHDRLLSVLPGSKPGRIRLFLFPVFNSASSLPVGSNFNGLGLVDGSNRSEDWFLNALNGSASAAELNRGFSDPNSVNVNNLLGLDDRNDNNYSNNNNNNDNKDDGNLGVDKGEGEKKVGQEVQSVPDSPIIETTSSFGSTSSLPSLGNLAPVRVRPDEGNKGNGGNRGGGVGIEEQFAQMGMSVTGGMQRQQVDEGGFVLISSPPTMVPVVSGGGGVEYGNRVYSDDERSDHGGVYRMQPLLQQTQQQQQMGGGQGVMSSQNSNKQLSAELPSPDSVSSDSSLSSAIARQKPVMYQDPIGQLPPGSNRLPPSVVDPNARIQMQQVSESGYTLHPQYEQHQQQMLQQQHHQQQQYQHQQLLQQQQQQHQQQQPVQTQPQYIPAGAHFVHQPPPGAVPMPGYYSVYPPQQAQHHPHQYPVYYVPAGQAPGYSLPVQQQQPNLGEAATSVPSSRPQTPPNPTVITASSAYNPTRSIPPPKSEMAPGVYRTTTATGPQLVQVPATQLQHQSQTQPQQQQQFVGYSQMHHPSQSIAPNSAAAAGYAYEYADPSPAQIYYTQPMAPQLAAQYQGVTSSPAMMMPDGSSQLPNDNTKQQIRSSQPL